MLPNISQEISTPSTAGLLDDHNDTEEQQMVIDDNVVSASQGFSLMQESIKSWEKEAICRKT